MKAVCNKEARECFSDEGTGREINRRIRSGEKDFVVKHKVTGVEYRIKEM